MRGVGVLLVALGSAMLVVACGAREPLEVGAGADEEPTGAPQASADPCAMHEHRTACCDAGCRVFEAEDSPDMIGCVSEERDCGLHPEVCASDEVCVLRDTSGRGGCSPHFDLDTVGRCEAR